MTVAGVYKVGMPPVARADSRLLILGSLPGDASLAAGRYYAHPTNQFWRLLGGAIGEQLDGLDYAARLDRLAARGVALWDVIATARRPGSLDGAIRGAEPNPLADFLARHGTIRTVAFNGGAAAKAGRRALSGMAATVRLLDLPSSSAALTLAFAAKAERWAALGEFV